MSDVGGKWVKPFDDGWIEYYELSPDAKTEDVKADIEARLDTFEKHKDALLDVLRSGPKRGTKPKPFDPEKAWRRLTCLAWDYFWRARLKQEITPATGRIQQLEAIAGTLGTARGLIDNALQSDVGDDLCSAWEDPPPRPFLVGDDDGSLAVAEQPDCNKAIQLDDEDYFGQAVTALTALQAAAIRASVAVPIRDGRPKGSAILSWGFIDALAATYRDITGLMPGAGDGPFSNFVKGFVNALGRANMEPESVVAVIKDARRRSLGHAAAAGAQSPFNSSKAGKKIPRNLP
jgi:hypothetical protein